MNVHDFNVPVYVPITFLKPQKYFPSSRTCFNPFLTILPYCAPLSLSIVTLSSTQFQIIFLFTLGCLPLFLEWYKNKVEDWGKFFFSREWSLVARNGLSRSCPPLGGWERTNQITPFGLVTDECYIQCLNGEKTPRQYYPRQIGQRIKTHSGK